MADSKKTIFTPERTVRYFLLEFVFIAIVGIIIWPLMDLIFTAIGGGSFTWGIGEHLVSPVVFALIVTIVEFIFWNFFHKAPKK